MSAEETGRAGGGSGWRFQGSQAGKGSALVGDGDQAAEQLGREAGAAVGPPGDLAGRSVNHHDRNSRVGVGNHRDIGGQPAALELNCPLVAGLTLEAR